jgi:uncharacterized protein involved in exopolysaccharide biosynthesis
MDNSDFDAPSYTSILAAEFAAFWRGLLARLKLAVPAGLILAVIGGVVLWCVHEPRYRSQATLRIIETRPFLAFQPDAIRGFAETQVELLRSAFIIGRAIENERLSSVLTQQDEIAEKEDAVRWISQRLKITRISNSDLYEISCTARYPESAKAVVSAIVKTYMEYHAADSDLNRHRMLDLLANEQVVRDTDIELKREKLRVLLKQAGGEDAVASSQPNGSGASGRSALMATLQQKLVETEVEIEMTRGRLEALRAQSDLAVQAPESATEAGPPADPVAVALKRAQIDLMTHEKLAETLRKKINFEHGEQVGHGDKSLEVQFAREELDNAEEVRRRIAERYVQLKIESRAPSQVMPVQLAQLPEFPEEPKFVTLLGIMAGVALILPMVLLLAWDLLHLRRRSRTIQIHSDD